MTLTTHNELVQGTDAWHDARRGILTASIIGKLITPKTIKPATNPESRNLTITLAAERITGYTEPTYLNDDMIRGVEEEPIARNWYSEHHAPVTEIGFMTEDKWGFRIGYSPDGLVGDDGLIEIKSRRQKTQLSTWLNDQPPIEVMAQLQCGLLVSGRQWIDYLSWGQGMVPYVKRIHPQPKWFEAIIEAATTFEENINVMIRTYQRMTHGMQPTERTNYDLDMVI